MVKLVLALWQYKKRRQASFGFWSLNLLTTELDIELSS